MAIVGASLTMNSAGCATVNSTETSYYRARYYDASSGRFNREDSASFAAGVNFYAYAVNSPLNFDDPTGFCPCDKKNCVPRSSLPPDTRLALALMKQASKLTGVTY